MNQIWCHNVSKIDSVYFSNATVIGARRLVTNETIHSVSPNLIRTSMHHEYDSP